MKVADPLITAIEGARAAPPDDYMILRRWVLIAFRNVLYQLLHAHSFEEAVVNTVMRAGDTDTNAAICGALLGSVYELEAIPEQWRDAVTHCRPEYGNPRVQRPRPQIYWPVDALKLAKKLVGN